METNTRACGRLSTFGIIQLKKKTAWGKITPHSLAATFRGAPGDDLVFRKIGDRTFFSKKGVNRKPSTPLQTGKRKLFAGAQCYASQMLEQPELP